MKVSPPNINIHESFAACDHMYYSSIDLDALPPPTENRGHRCVVQIQDGFNKPFHSKKTAVAQSTLYPQLNYFFGEPNKMVKLNRWPAWQQRPADGENASGCESSITAAREAARGTEKDAHGITGGVCHHGIPIVGSYVSMPSAERLVYHLIAAEWVMRRHHVSALVVDTACRMKNFKEIQVMQQDGAVRPVKDVRNAKPMCVLPFLHSRNHNAQCQLKNSAFHATQEDGVGLGWAATDANESVWKQLKAVSCLTRYMSLHRRQDVLDAALLEIAYNKRSGLAYIISNRAAAWRAHSEEALQNSQDLVRKAAEEGIKDLHAASAHYLQVTLNAEREGAAAPLSLPAQLVQEQENMSVFACTKTHLPRLQHILASPAAKQLYKAVMDSKKEVKLINDLSKIQLLILDAIAEASNSGSTYPIADSWMPIVDPTIIWSTDEYKMSVRNELRQEMRRQLQITMRELAAEHYSDRRRHKTAEGKIKITIKNRMTSSKEKMKMFFFHWKHWGVWELDGSRSGEVSAVEDHHAYVLCGGCFPWDNESLFQQKVGKQKGKRKSYDDDDDYKDLTGDDNAQTRLYYGGLYCNLESRRKRLEEQERLLGGEIQTAIQTYEGVIRKLRNKVGSIEMEEVLKALEPVPPTTTDPACSKGGKWLMQLKKLQLWQCTYDTLKELQRWWNGGRSANFRYKGNPLWCNVEEEEEEEEDFLWEDLDSE